jgi:hypothetical protein
MPRKPKSKAATGTVVAVRMADEPMAQVDSWIASHEERGLSRPEAIRRLVEIALAGIDPARAKRSSTSSKSAKLAGDQLDRMSDRSATAAEQETRKRRLLGGPSEFREVRKDRNKR